ncbi:MAG: hypothetical protein NVS3B12_34670 [Acidimicrobiales bacterium]
MSLLLAVATMKGLVGDARSDPDLTPAITGDPCDFDRSIESAVSVPHHCGCFGHRVQQFL